MRTPPIPRLVEALRHAADLLDTKGDQALQLAKDWSEPLGASSGSGIQGSQRTITVLDEYGRPDQVPVTAVEQAALQPDMLARHYPQIVLDMNALFDNASDIVRRIIILTKDAKPVNERMGIGWCAGCNKHINGTQNNRLRRVDGELLCPKCELRSRRRRSRSA